MKLFVVLLLALLSFGTGALAQNVALGTADAFALLGASGVTNVSKHTHIIGDVGSSPTPDVTGLDQSQVNGKLYLTASPVTAQAQIDLAAAYGQAAGEPCGTDLTGLDLGGMTLGPGVYCFSSSAGLTGTLTLDAYGNTKANWIFQVGSTLTTASDSKVIIKVGHKQSPNGKVGPEPLWSKGLRGCNVYWQVGSSATIADGSIFVGQIIALSDITLNGGTLRGKALTGNGAITMSDRETVSGARCNVGTD